MNATNIRTTIFWLFLIVGVAWLVSHVWLIAVKIAIALAIFLILRKIAGLFGLRLSNLRKSRGFFRGH